MFRLGKKIFVKGPRPLLGIARTCYGYAAGGMPLVFTQEDFLVVHFWGNNCKLIRWHVLCVSIGVSTRVLITDEVTSRV